LKGIVFHKDKTFIFRTDHGFEKSVWMWDIQENDVHCPVNKIQKMPKGVSGELFDIDNPPRTVRFIPGLM